MRHYELPDDLDELDYASLPAAPNKRFQVSFFLSCSPVVVFDKRENILLTCLPVIVSVRAIASFTCC